jgi:hypothetical protein
MANVPGTVGDVISYVSVDSNVVPSAVQFNSFLHTLTYDDLRVVTNDYNYTVASASVISDGE